MRFSLRTLLLLTAVGGPLLAGAWFVGRAMWRDYRIWHAWEVEGRTYPAAVEYVDKGR